MCIDGFPIENVREERVRVFVTERKYRILLFQTCVQFRRIERLEFERTKEEREENAERERGKEKGKRNRTRWREKEV